jgi:Spy/CpxP family protein refolding chaperone
MMRPGAVKAMLAMAGIFAAGAVAGTAAGVAWAKHSQTRLSAQEFVDRQLKRRVDQLGLSPEQVDQIKPIMKEHEELLRTIRRRSFAEMGQVFRDMNARIEGELTPEQRERFLAIQVEERERYERQIQSRSRRAGDSENGKPPLPHNGHRPPPPPPPPEGSAAPSP